MNIIKKAWLRLRWWGWYKGKKIHKEDILVFKGHKYKCTGFGEGFNIKTKSGMLVPDGFVLEDVSIKKIKEEEK